MARLRLNLLFLLCATFIFYSNIYAQKFSNLEFIKDINPELKKYRYDFQENSTAGTEASSWFDVTYYRLELTVLTQPDSLIGKVTVNGICKTDSTRSLTLDLVKQMHIDSVIVNGERNSFVQNKNSFFISLSHLYVQSDLIIVQVYYRGVPVPTGFGSFVFDSHSGVPWIYTLSQPFGARDWWPCKNEPGDKADSADILVTCNSNFKAGSEGILVSALQNSNGMTTYHWKERYPIAPYLISLAITNYAEFSNWFHYSALDSMQVLNYVLPEHYDMALQTIPRVVDMLEIFTKLFGTYPFIKEKYGHAEFKQGGAMEHQTMTSTSTFDEIVLSHELAHQWFGDMITCRTWSDIWLNEGFAQYSSALYLEQRYGTGAYWKYMNSQIDNAVTSAGEIGNPDTTIVRNLFDSKLIYSKGAVVLHMLRHVLGDSVFFQAIWQYANDSQLQYNSVVTNDFQSVCERVSGKNLEYFFREWIYGEKYPVYEISWSTNDSSAVDLNIYQVAGRTNPVFFTMPVDIRIIGGSKDTTFTIFNNEPVQHLIVRFNAKPDTVIIDPEGWIMKFVLSGNNQLPSGLKLEQNYPNPFNLSTRIIYRLRSTEKVTLKIYDLLGREIATLVNSQQSPGIYEYQWTPQNFASGVYFYRLTAGAVNLQKKMMLIK